MTAYLGVVGNDFILNGKHSDLNAEDIYGPLTIPVFGRGVVYDVPNAKLMEQKKFIKFGLTQEALVQHVPLIEREVLNYIKSSPRLKGSNGDIEITKAMAEITIFTAARTLQGAEVRNKLTDEMAKLYHDLDMGFQPINFLLPWAPLPHNHRRDIARDKMNAIYKAIIDKRRALSEEEEVEREPDMIWNLMQCRYRDGDPLPDDVIANIMIALLMAGQHASSAGGSWIILRLASQPEITEELYQEQVQVLGKELPPLRYEDLDKLPLLMSVVKETLRIHSSIVAILRKVTKPLSVPGTPYVVGTDKVLLAAPSVSAMDDKYFTNGETWNPHRWLSRDDEDEGAETIDYGYGEVSKSSRSPYLPFGAGRHRCIGEKFAYINLGVIVATLVRNFRFYTLDGSKGIPDTDYTSLFAMPKRPAVIRWERRNP